MSSIIDVDFLKFVRETVDWLGEKYKGITNSQKKATLNKVANQISRLAVNKAAYLAALKSGLTSEDENIDLHTINTAIATAKKDTDTLHELLTKLDLNASKFSFSLKHGLEKLTRLKQIKLSELEALVATNEVGPVETQKVIEELASFESQWMALGTEIDILIKEVF